MQWMCEAALYTKKEKAFFDVTQIPDHVLFSSHPATQQEQQDRELESGKKEREREGTTLKNPESALVSGLDTSTSFKEASMISIPNLFVHDIFMTAYVLFRSSQTVSWRIKKQPAGVSSTPRCLISTV